jgi:UDP-N-acetylmuramoyl-L-alanyl-D-glutamate--2,6-diaminopimelate ligase
MIDSGRLFEDQAFDGEFPATLAGLSRDSRAVKPGDAWVAMGSPIELPLHAAQALAAGAASVLAEQVIAKVPTFTRVSHARWTFARASAALMGVDRGCPPLLGVTGTKGKSTVVHCTWWALGSGAARVGTIGWHDGHEERPNSQTTPPAEELHRFLAALSPGCQGVALEVSSHGCDQQRLAGLRLRGLVWTGLGHDHLDYHGSAAAYLAAKLRAHRWLDHDGTAIINSDDATGYVAAHAARVAGAKTISLGFGEQRIGAQEHARIVRQSDGYRLELQQESYSLPSQLPGDYNAWNTAAGALMAAAAGVPLRVALARLVNMPAVPGRMELLALSPATYVDYAHTPESITAAINAVRQAHPQRRLGIVFGCGGDRDRTKRPLMGRSAGQADVVVITTDNSRSEAPQSIADDVLAGVPDRKGALVELDRGSAIVRARRLVGTDGVVIVAGKGHERTQDILGHVQAWDDRAFVRSLSHPGGRQ